MLTLSSEFDDKSSPQTKHTYHESYQNIFFQQVENFHDPIMLYLFDITKFPSNWMHLDMGLTAASVQTLKEHIQAKYKVNVEDQVLLISGGVCLDPSKIVCHYSAGTDSNPIYFFNKKIDKTTSFPECPDVTTTTDELSTLYKKLAKVTPSFQAVIDRAHLAERMATSARLIMEHCEEIIRDHHVANQGWLAAVANYSDVVSNCMEHYEMAKKKFDEYLELREYCLGFLEKFKRKLPLLKKIPILKKLLRPDESQNRLMLESETSEGCEYETEDISTSFFDWVGKDEHGDCIETIFEKCEADVQFYKEDTFENSFSAVPTTLSLASSSNKEINVSFWLSHLDQLINRSKAVVEEQNKISSSIQLNVARMKDCKDLSILPHLCETHEQELAVMNENHSILKEIENTCIKAKYEFTLNVQSRIGWIVNIENELQHVGVQLDVFVESLENIKYQMDILEKIDAAPTAYFACISETVRRRSFSQSFLMWASEMACRLHTMHNEEVARRKDFLAKFEDTFVKMLFPGLDDLPPSYGTKAPPYFDTSLPKLTVEDIEYMKKALPDLPKELSEYLSLEDPSNLSYYLSFKSILNTQPDKLEEEIQVDNLSEKVENQSVNAEKIVTKDGLGETSLTAIHGLPHLRDIDRGCESETDTEEFEKVGQSPLELNFNKQVSVKPCMQDMSTSIEENLEICRSEHDNLKSIVNQFCSTASQSINKIKSELNEFKRDYLLSKSQFLEIIKMIVIGYEKLCEEQKNHEQSVIVKLTSEHQNEISDFRRLAQVKNEEIKSLRTNLVFLENKMKKVSEEATTERNNSEQYKQKCEEMTVMISTLEKEKERTIKELTERLNREHMDKMKTLQSRFRLMTMERTPSDSSLEKALELSSPSIHQSVYIQMQENFELQKEAIIKEAVSAEAEKWKKIVERVEKKNEFDTDMIVRFLRDKEEEKINELKKREKKLLEEIEQYTETIKELTAVIETSPKVEQEYEENQGQGVSNAENERSVSVLEFQKEKTETVAMEGSYSEGKVDCATSPIKQRRSISKSVNVLGKSTKPNVDAIKPGDCLVIVWDEEYQNFRIVQNGPIIYFLHLDCINPLGLQIIEGTPRRPNKLYCLGEYVEKEYCYARKSENRFNVPQGTRFFRVTVRPLQKEKINQPLSVSQSSETSTSVSSQQTTSISIPEMELAPIPPLPRWKYTPKQLPPDTIGIDGDNIPGVSNPSDNKSENSNVSLPFHSASYDIHDQHQDPKILKSVMSLLLEEWIVQDG